jgi:hypothetical protein
MMNCHRTFFCRTGVFATLLVVSLPAAEQSARAGDAIRFSKPAVAIVAPPRTDHDLPEIRERGLDFSTPNFAPPVAPPPRPAPLLRQAEPRDEEREGVHRLLQTPKIFTDPAEEKARMEALREAQNNPFKASLEKNRAKSPFGKEAASLRPDSTGSLSPVTDLDWRPEDRNSSRRTLRNGRDANSALAGRDDSDVGVNAGRPVPFMDFTSPRRQEKLSPAQLQRQEDFRQLLNPNAGAAGRAPNSLQPVANAADAKSGALAMPTLGGGYDPRTADPTAAFNQRQQERLRGPVIEDVNRRYNNPKPAESGASAGGSSPTQGPRPPTRREFPSRTF